MGNAQTVATCKGCAQPIKDGELRRGDNWHAACHAQVVASYTGHRPAQPRVRGVRGLTSTQEIILRAAAVSPSGSVGFGAGDRKGTRVAKIDDFGRPWIIAYSCPEFFLEGRGLLAKGNEPFVYRITPAGREALHPGAYETCSCGERTHRDEAACVHCGVTKDWAR
jgi:hypothetical protein